MRDRAEALAEIIERGRAITDTFATVSCGWDDVTRAWRAVVKAKKAAERLGAMWQARSDQVTKAWDDLQADALALGLRVPDSGRE